MSSKKNNALINKMWSCGGAPTSDSGSTQFGSPRISNDSN
jgi:hypothetical protein